MAQIDFGMRKFLGMNFFEAVGRGPIVNHLSLGPGAGVYAGEITTDRAWDAMGFLSTSTGYCDSGKARNANLGKIARVALSFRFSVPAFRCGLLQQAYELILRLW